MQIKDMFHFHAFPFFLKFLFYPIALSFMVIRLSNLTILHAIIKRSNIAHLMCVIFIQRPFLINMTSFNVSYVIYSCPWAIHNFPLNMH